MKGKLSFIPYIFFSIFYTYSYFPYIQYNKIFYMFICLLKTKPTD